MRLAAAYLPGAGEPNAVDSCPRPRAARAASPVYAALRSLGREGVAELVDRCCDHAAQMAEALAASGRLRGAQRGVAQPGPRRSGRGRGRGLAAVVPAIAGRIQAEGTCWLGPTVYRGTPALRVSFSNWSTTPGDVARSAAAIVAATEAETGMRPKAPTGIEPV